MFFCAELNGDVCVNWVEYQPFLSLPEGVGLKIGGSLLLVSVLAWGVQFIARLILNR